MQARAATVSWALRARTRAPPPTPDLPHPPAKQPSSHRLTDRATGYQIGEAGGSCGRRSGQSALPAGSEVGEPSGLHGGTGPGTRISGAKLVGNADGVSTGREACAVRSSARA